MDRAARVAAHLGCGTCSSPLKAGGPFNAGELHVQGKAGRSADGAFMGMLIRAGGGAVPAHKRKLVNEQKVAFCATFEPNTGFPWASFSYDEERFILETDGSQQMTARLGKFTDPQLLSNIAHDSAPVAFIAMSYTDRLRFRCQGQVQQLLLQEKVAKVDMTETFPNCKAYIPRVSVEPKASAGLVRSRSTALSAAQQAAVNTAFTFFVASGAPHDDGGPFRVDMSHRGGKPGFLRALSSSTVTWPDYPGNGSFMTIGNLSIYPKACLLLPFLEGGKALQLLGTVQVEWRQDGQQCYDAAERQCTMRVEKVVETSGVSLDYKLLDCSSFNPRLCGLDGSSVTEGDGVVAGSSINEQQHERKYVTVKRGAEVAEGVGVFFLDNNVSLLLSPLLLSLLLSPPLLSRSLTSKLYLTIPVQGKYNPGWRPGQFITLLVPQGKDGEGGEPLVRSWTVSSSPLAMSPSYTNSQMEIVVKKMANGRDVTGDAAAGGDVTGDAAAGGDVAGDAAAGGDVTGASVWFHEAMHNGQELEVVNVDGDFVIDPLSEAGRAEIRAMRRAQWESGQEGAHGARLDTMEGGEEQAWQQCRPLKLLFLSAGIGITPAIAMLRGLQTAARGQTPLLPCAVDVVLVHSVSSMAQVPYKDELEAMALASGGLVRLQIAWTITGKSSGELIGGAVAGVTSTTASATSTTASATSTTASATSTTASATSTTASATSTTASATSASTAISSHDGRLSGAILAAMGLADVTQRDVYVCGPSAYMESAFSLMQGLGVHESRLHTESFDY
jgi:ferredoxin-NADP reductase